MKNMIFGLWAVSGESVQAEKRMEQLRKAWGLEANTPPILESSPLKIWSNNAEGLLHGWRGDLFFLCSGKVYDILVPFPAELKDDTLGQLAHLYHEYGDDFARHVNGAFSLIVFNRPREQLRLIQSRNPSSTPLNWSCGPWGLCFSNYIRAQLAFAPEMATRTDPEGLYQLLSRTYIIPPRTFYDQISQVPHGSLLHAESETLVEYDPWKIPTEKIVDEAGALEEFEHLLSSAVGRFISGVDNQVFLLSGGYDSSVNVALGSKLSSDQLTTIGIGARKFNTDAPYACMVADHVGTNHLEYMFDGEEVEKLPEYVCTMETPYYEPGMLLTCRALELASSHGCAMVGGEGTDQVFGSCAAMAFGRHRKSNFSRRMIRQMFQTLAHNPLTRTREFPSRLENRFFGKDNVNNWCGGMGFRDSDIRKMAHPNSWRECGYDSQAISDGDLDAIMRFNCQVLNRDYLNYGILPICGRLSDQLGLNTFTPYLDKRVMDFILSLDHSLRTPLLDSAQGTFDFKHLQKQLALKLLPAEIFDRPKQGGSINPFIHLEDHPRLAAIEHHLVRSEYIQQVLRPESVQVLFFTPKKNAAKIFLLLTMDLWYSLVAKNPLGPLSKVPTLSEYLNEKGG